MSASEFNVVTPGLYGHNISGGSTRQDRLCLPTCIDTSISSIPIVIKPVYKSSEFKPSLNFTSFNSKYYTGAASYEHLLLKKFKVKGRWTHLVFIVLDTGANVSSIPSPEWGYDIKKLPSPNFLAEHPRQRVASVERLGLVASARERGLREWGGVRGEGWDQGQLARTPRYRP